MLRIRLVGPATEDGTVSFRDLAELAGNLQSGIDRVLACSSVETYVGLGGSPGRSPRHALSAWLPWSKEVPSWWLGALPMGN